MYMYIMYIYMCACVLKRSSDGSGPKPYPTHAKSQALFLEGVLVLFEAGIHVCTHANPNTRHTYVGYPLAT